MAGSDVQAEPGGSAPDRAGIVLVTLILVAGVANLNLSVANVALPSIGEAFDSSQVTLNLIAVGYSLGLAASVLYLGAIGDRYGRKLLLVLGTALAIPMSLLAGFAPSDEVLFVARVGGGLAAGMAYPTTLALIAALWSGPGRTKSIALWSALGGAIASLGPARCGRAARGVRVGVGLPDHSAARGRRARHGVPLRAEPCQRDERARRQSRRDSLRRPRRVAHPRDQLRSRAERGDTRARSRRRSRAAALLAFFIRQRRAPNPLYDLEIASRRIFWVAACAGIIVFGSLMAAMFVSQQYLQNVLGYSTLDAGSAIIPAALVMVVVAPRSAKLIEARGARFTLLCGYVFLFAAFLWMLLVWNESSPYWHIALAYIFIGAGVGLAGTPASHSLTGSVPVTRAGMASGTADLQRDLGGAIMQSIFGALLTAGYAAAVSAEIAASDKNITDSTQAALTKSFDSAEAVAEQHPQYADAIIAGAKQAFLDGDDWAYSAGVVAIVLGAVLVFFMFPKHDDERRLLAEYHAQDTAAEPG